MTKTMCENLEDSYEQQKNNKNFNLDEFCKSDDGSVFDDGNCKFYNDTCQTQGHKSKKNTKSVEEATEEATEHFSMMNDSTSMNSILVFGLFIILFLFVYIYGFHGILKFEKNLNYLIAILFSAFGIILSIMLIIGVIRHVSSSTMSDEEKGNSRNALLVVAILVVFFSMMAIIRYNYGKLFNALNRTLPLNKPPRPPRGRGRGKGRGRGR
tara:strand:- start:245 stop:877 length:633 start_codon:yes stop_codon:yes gene_type:complete